MTILDHLWQSTLVAILAYFLTLLFRNNSASIRYWLWLAASLKFLLPFSILAALGRMAFVQTIPAGSIAVLTKIRPVAMPFAAVAQAPAAEHPSWLGVLLAIWLLGFVSIMTLWLVRWRRLSATARSAKLLAFDLPIPVKLTPFLMEPGLVGIRRPVILLPEGIVNWLSRAEIDAILNHELCHLRRRDNLLASVHMLVEGLFWFHPLVWFIGARLIEERERACDEGVLACGKNPLEYAQAILKVCHLYFRSPLPCASGVSGADLDRRITAIMAKEDVREIDPGRKLLLGALLAVTVMIPLVTGGLKSAPAARLTKSLAAALMMPLRTTTEVAVRGPAVAPARRAEPVIWHRQPKVAFNSSIQPHETLLSPPTIDAGPYVIFIPVLKLDAESQPVDASEVNVCRPPQQLPASRMMGPQVCLPQSEWDRIKTQGLQLMPDGRTLSANYDKERSVTTRGCYPAARGIAASALAIGCQQ